MKSALASLVRIDVSFIDDSKISKSPMLERGADEHPASVDADAIAGVAKALAHPARVRIVTFLLSRPGCMGGDIVDEVGLAQSTVSEHLRILKGAGLVVGEVERPRICCSLDPAALAPLQALIGRIEARGSASAGAPGCYTPEPKTTMETNA